jgi:ribosomal protein S18 acetylase RimI-like enzyme
MTAPNFRTLGPGDEAKLEFFLAQTPESSMFLRANLAKAGIVGRGEAFQGTYVGAFEDGRLAGAAALFWNGNLMMQCPPALAAPLVAETLAAALPRAASGLIGPCAQVEAAIEIPPFSLRRARLAARQDLFALTLGNFAMPALPGPGYAVGAATAADRPILRDWRYAYCREVLAWPEGESSRRNAADEIDRTIDEANGYVLRLNGTPVAYAGINAKLPDIVQIGGVYVPPAERDQGYGRLATAAALADVKAKGVRQAILFTGIENVAAKFCYEGLGFRVVGDYAIVLY